MQTVGFQSHLLVWLRRIFPPLIGLALFGLFVSSMAAGAVVNDVIPEALGSISGTVTDADGQPASDVEVVAYRSAGTFWPLVRTAQTDAMGGYLLPALNTGIYRLHFRDPQGDHAQEYYDKAPGLDGATDIPVAGNDVTGVDARLELPAQISGTMTIVEGVVPIGGRVFLYSPVGPAWQMVTQTHTITATGGYQFGALIAGTYRVCGVGSFGAESMDSYFACYGGTGVEDARSIQLATGETITGIDFQLGGQLFEGLITGVVTSAGVPLAGVKVSLYDGAIPPPELQSLPLVYTYTNAAGGYRLGGLRDAFYLVGFSDPAGAHVTRYYRDQRRPEQAESISLRGGATIRNINIDLPQAGAISGRIRFTDDRPAAFTQANLYWAAGELWELRTYYQLPLDTAGNYAIKGLEPGTYHVCFPFYLELDFPYPNTLTYYPNCYGTGRLSSLGYEFATPISVSEGATVTGIDATIGPAILYMPGVHNQ